VSYDDDPDSKWKSDSRSRAGDGSSRQQLFDGMRKRLVSNHNLAVNFPSRIHQGHQMFFEIPEKRQIHWDEDQMADISEEMVNKLVRWGRNPST